MDFSWGSSQVDFVAYRYLNHQLRLPKHTDVATTVSNGLYPLSYLSTFTLKAVNVADYEAVEKAKMAAVRQGPTC